MIELTRARSCLIFNFPKPKFGLLVWNVQKFGHVNSIRLFYTFGLKRDLKMLTSWTY